MSVAHKLVCVIDNDPSVRRALVRLIRTHGYETQPFASGREFLDWHEVGQAAVTVIDVAMPGRNGFELHTLLKSSGQLIPTIFISAYSRENYEAHAATAGAVGIWRARGQGG